MKILVTGGHHNSALVIAQALRQKNYSIIWAGHRYTMVGDRHDSLEYQEVTEANFPFIDTIAGKFHRRAHPIHWLRLPLGFIQAFFILINTKPQLILSFGGYVAVPLALVGKLFKIPIIAFEQTATIGRANKLISKFSHKNFLTWQSSLRHFPPKTSEVAGLPLRPQFFSTKKPKKIFKNNQPTILITGGKQGAHIINRTLLSLLPNLLKRFNVIHQTGGSLKTKDFSKAKNIKQSLPKDQQSSYLVKPHFTWQQMLENLIQADLVISRSGAHIVYELLALKKPAILIPLPFAFKNEQAKNAQKAVAAKLATLLPQKNLSPQSLSRAINRFFKATKKPTDTDPLVKANATQKVIAYITTNFPNAKNKA